jgi:hypothetical protein
MTEPLFQSEQLAAEWANRICNRLKEINVPAHEVEETRTIIFAFTKTAADELSRQQQMPLPYTDQLLTVDATTAHQIIDLFLRGINHVSKKVRDTGKPWDERKVILESMAWKLFNLSKLLVAFLSIPNPQMDNMLTSTKDLQVMMKQSADVLLQEELTGQPTGSSLPNFPGR